MIPVDLHTHSLFSLCGVHTVLEMLTQARARGMAGLAITDHGPALGGRLNSTLFDRLRDPVPGVRLLKGVECNIKDEDGAIDMPADLLPLCDVVLLGLHPNTPRRGDAQRNTDLLLAALRTNPFVDIVSHPNSAEYPVDFARLAPACASLGVALEINNSKTALRRVDDRVTVELIGACAKARCLVAVNSDAHVLGEVGDDSAVRPLLDAARFPAELVVNRDLATASAWLERRRPAKTAQSTLSRG